MPYWITTNNGKGAGLRPILKTLQGAKWRAYRLLMPYGTTCVEVVPDREWHVKSNVGQACIIITREG